MPRSRYLPKKRFEAGSGATANAVVVAVAEAKGCGKKFVICGQTRLGHVMGPRGSRLDAYSYRCTRKAGVPSAR